MGRITGPGRRVDAVRRLDAKARELLQARIDRQREQTYQWRTTLAARRSAKADALAALPLLERRIAMNERDERRAAGRLKLARNLKDRGNWPAAREWLLKLVKDYPETTVADDARELLLCLPPQLASR